MKGVSKRVVEIVEPRDEGIERVLVFLKPDSEAVRLGREQEAAERYAAGLVTWRRTFASRWAALLLPALLGAAGAIVWFLH